MSMVEVNLEQLDKLLEEKRFWFKVIRLYLHAEKYTGENNNIQAFSFKREFLSERESEATPLTHHNCVRMKDGGLKEIPLIERPEPPSWLSTSIRKTI